MLSLDNYFFNYFPLDVNSIMAVVLQVECVYESYLIFGTF